MGECHCSKIAIMQLFHELKQQFPALPDHVVSQCIAQNSHDRETCARSLRATQESRPPPGAFPPPPPQPEFLPLSECPVSLAMSQDAQPPDQQQQPQQQVRRRSRAAMTGHPRATRPVSLDIGTSQRCIAVQVEAQEQQQHAGVATAHPSSAPAVYAGRSFFEDLGNSSSQGNPSFALNVNVACNPVSSHDYQAANQPIEAICSQPQQQQSTLIPAEPTTRSFTSVSLTLRPPSSEPQPPIDISSQGSNLTYSSSSVDPRGFQSRLQISIGHGASGGVTAARIKPPPVPQRPTSLVTLTHSPGGANRPPGLPAGLPSQLPRPTTTVSAPVTPSGPMQSLASSAPPPISLPTTPLAPLTILTDDEPFTPPLTPPPELIPMTDLEPVLFPVSSMAFEPQPGPSTSFGATPQPGPSTSYGVTSELNAPRMNPAERPPSITPSASTGAIPRVPQSSVSRDYEYESDSESEADALPPEYKALIDQVEDEFKPLVTEQLIRKYRLAKAVEEEKNKLETMRKEVEELSRPSATRMSPKEYERKLRSEIYQLQLECDKLAAEVDRRTADAQIPLGETNEEFYKTIYTGQQYVPPQSSMVPPPLPSQPPAWEPVPSQTNIQDEADGPLWVCQKCTFDNHPLLNKCEQCDTPRYEEGGQGETQDIHIQVTHHHNFSPRRTIHNWVV